MNAFQQRWLYGLAFSAVAVAIWCSDLRWVATLADTLPLALGIPIGLVLGMPWQFKSTPISKRDQRIGGLTLLGLMMGWIIGSVTIMSFSFTLCFMIWVKHTFKPQARRNRLGLLLLLSFPWLVLEWDQVGYAFRLSSAFVVEQFFNFLQITTLRNATDLHVLGVPIQIEAACAGWNLLQLTLLTGVAIGAYEIPSKRRFILLLAFLPAVAWVANFLRILVLSGVALSFDVELASGSLHGLTGLAVLGIVLIITKGLCAFLVPSPSILSKTVKAP
jgi:exosortase/archaeosortase family protein